MVGRLACDSSHVDHQGFWAMNGYGVVAVYKSDWIRFGGKYITMSILAGSRDFLFINVFEWMDN